MAVGHPRSAAHADDPAGDSEGEHILIQGDGDGDRRSPETVSQVTHIKDVVRGTSTELTHYREGFVRAQSRDARGRSLSDVLIELEYLDPAFRTSANPARGWLAGAAAAWLAVLLGATLLPGRVANPQLAAGGAIAVTIALCAALMFVYCRKERIEFATRHGRARLLSLGSSFGCMRKTRRAAADISAAAERAAGASPRRGPDYLRAEMRAHYAMRDRGEISDAVCSQSTARILSRFG